MEEYQLTIIGGVAVLGAAANFYLNRKRRKAINNFVYSVNNQILPKAKKVQESAKELRTAISKLELKFKT